MLEKLFGVVAGIIFSICRDHKFLLHFSLLFVLHNHRPRLLVNKKHRLTDGRWSFFPQQLKALGPQPNYTGAAIPQGSARDPSEGSKTFQSSK